jgi:transcription elongation factor Elf1
MNTMPPKQPPEFKCAKCNHHEFARQIRKVNIVVGWNATQMTSISPCKMCTKCGDTSVDVQLTIGDLVDMVPAAMLQQHKVDTAKLEETEKAFSAPSTSSLPPSLAARARKTQPAKKAKRGR